MKNLNIFLFCSTIQEHIASITPSLTKDINKEMIPRSLVIGPILRYQVLLVTRMISTRSSLGAKYSFKKDLRSSNRNYIIEEPKQYQNPKVQHIYNEVATYLSGDTDRMPNNIKSKVLQRKLVSLLSLDGVQEKVKLWKYWN